MEDPKIRQIQKTLAFTEEEYRQRLARVRVTMAERGLDGLLVHGPENICYLSGFRTSATTSCRCWWCHWRRIRSSWCASTRRATWPPSRG